MRNILAVGAYERDNFGDALFLEVLKRALPDDNIIPGSIIAGDVRDAYGFVTIPYDYVLTNYSIDAVWVVGGEVGGVNTTAALEMSAEKLLLKHDTPQQLGVDKKIENLLGASRRNKRAYIPDMKIYKKNIETPLIIQSVGLRHILVGDIDNRNLLTRAKKLVVRDSLSYELCRDNKVNATLSPDVVHSLPRFYEPNVHAVESGILIQIKESTLKEYKKSDIKKILREVGALYSEPILLFAAGTANGHDSLELYQSFVKELEDDIKIKVITTRDPLRLVDYIAAAKVVIGTSLHVRVLASSYGVPRIALCNEKTAKYASEWDNKWPSDIDVMDIPKALHEIKSNTTPVREDKLTAMAYDELRKSVNVIPNSSAEKRLDGETLAIDWFMQQQYLFVREITTDAASYYKQITDLQHKLESETSRRDDEIRVLNKYHEAILRSRSYRVGRWMTSPIRFFRQMIKKL